MDCRLPVHTLVYKHAAGRARRVRSDVIRPYLGSPAILTVCSPQRATTMENTDNVSTQTKTFGGSLPSLLESRRGSGMLAF